MSYPRDKCERGMKEGKFLRDHSTIGITFLSIFIDYSVIFIAMREILSRDLAFAISTIENASLSLKKQRSSLSLSMSF